MKSVFAISAISSESGTLFLGFETYFRASKCEYWTDEKVRHCNAYHTKDGLWRFIREKYKERKAKKENLLAIKRDLHEVFNLM